MGCCESSSDGDMSIFFNTNNSWILTPDKTKVFRQTLNQIPVPCRQAIINLPVRDFFNAYEKHLLANYHAKERHFGRALALEKFAIRDFLVLLPEHQDHFIFADIYRTLSKCLLEMGLILPAIETSQKTLDILLKHIPSNNEAISTQYFNLAICYLNSGIYNESWQYLSKTIVIARHSNVPNLENLDILETTLYLLTQLIMARVLNSTATSNRNDNEQEASHAIITEPNQAECEHSLDQQTELSDNDTITNHVLQHDEE
ncbi:unnamed protein product [Rotaria sordida]|uniref:Tetratricopeptide repeat protein n=1 Tax=Rotaria sordida TaxID=392033 RepID=A0A815Y8T9_9BILA|nr:unnamed protein product [Rotaria sordida]CAF1568338.1 unnamed protein product [Rotaria sordida]